MLQPKPVFTHSEVRWRDDASGNILVHAENESPWRFHFGVQCRPYLNYGYGARPKTMIRARECIRDHGGSGVMSILIPSLKQVMRDIMAAYYRDTTFCIYGEGNRAALYRSWKDEFIGFTGVALDTGLGLFGDRGGCVWFRDDATED